MQRMTDIDGLYHLDPAHSTLGFTVKHAGLSRVRGNFDAFHGYAIIDAANPSDSALMVSVSVASIATKVADRDAHLRSADFFDVATFPAMTFVGTSFEVVDEDHVRVGGDLTIKDVTRPLELVFEFTGGATDPFGNRRIGFEAMSLISRKDFGLTWNAALETGGWLVADEITLDLEVSAVQQADQPAGLDVDQDAIANLALEPDPAMVEAELAQARAAGTVAADGDPTPTPRGVDGNLASSPPARRAAGTATGEGGRPRRALDEPAGPEPEEPVKPASSTSWWRRITGR